MPGEILEPKITVLNIGYRVNIYPSAVEIRGTKGGLRIGDQKREVPIIIANGNVYVNENYQTRGTIGDGKEAVVLLEERSFRIIGKEDGFDQVEGNEPLIKYRASEKGTANMADYGGVVIQATIGEWR